MTGDLDKAQSSAADAVRIATTAHYPILELRGLGFLAEIQSGRGNPDGLWALALQGLTQFWSENYPGVRANQFYSDLGYAAEDTGQWWLALTFWRAALEMAPEDNHLFVALTKEHVARIALLCGNVSEAETQLGQSKKLLQSLRLDATANAYRANAEIELAKLELYRGNMDAARAALAEATSMSPHVESSFVAFDYYQTSARLNHVLHRDNEALQAARSAIDISETRLASLGREHDRLRWNRENGAAYREAVEILLGQPQATQQALELWEWYRAAALRAGETRAAQSHLGIFARQSGPANNFDLPHPAIGNLLPSLKHETALVFARLSRSYVAWVFDDRGIFTHELPDAESLDALARTFGGECANPQSDIAGLQSHARKLYDLLIAPVESHLVAGRTLIIEGDGVMADVALQALQDRESRYLGNKFRLLFAPAIAYLRFSGSVDLFTASDKILIVATSGDSSEPGLPALPGLQEQSRELASNFRHAMVIEGQEATRQAVASKLPEAQIFHFDGHAVIKVDRNGLVLASSPDSTGKQAELLDVAFIERMPLGQCRLVVLAACSSSRSRYGFGDPENMVRAFLRAGSSHVVASRWDTDSLTTALLMRSFYQRLLAGDGVSAALQTAEQAVQANRATAHPYYWAAFSTFGVD